MGETEVGHQFMSIYTDARVTGEASSYGRRKQRRDVENTKYVYYTDHLNDNLRRRYTDIGRTQVGIKASYLSVSLQ